MLAERSREHSRLFREHREAVFFESDEELIAETRRYLADDVGRTRIALAGRRRCVDDGYDHAAALRRMLAAATGAPHRSETDSTTAREEAA
jgi:spore maturation protein CgeB